MSESANTPSTTTLSPYSKRYPLSNGVVFNNIMSDVDLCKETVERILGIELEHIEIHDTEHDIRLHPDVHGVRMDAYLKADGRSIDIEMQNIAHASLPKRFRFYQANIDLSNLQKGEKYHRLSDSYIIFLCNEDPFHLGDLRYTFKWIRTDGNQIHEDAGYTHIVINTQAFAEEPSPKLRNLLQYIAKGRVAKDDAFIARLDKAVDAINANEKWVRDNMFFIDALEDYKMEVEIRQEMLEQAQREAEQAEQKADQAAEQARAELQAEMREKLIAQGIDPSVLD